MFKSKNARVVVNNLYINQHVIDAYEERQTKKLDLSLPSEVVINILIQRSKEKGEIKMKKLRGCIQMKDNLFLIFNLYEKCGEINAKALTILRKEQLNTSSKNFPMANYLPRGLITKRPEIVLEEYHFDMEINNDYLEDNFGDFDEMDVLYV